MATYVNHAGRLFPAKANAVDIYHKTGGAHLIGQAASGVSGSVGMWVGKP